MAGNIFVSYRRDDSKHAAGRLVDRLQADFDQGQLFLDVANIELGLDFVEVINERVAACDVMLVVIGPQWLNAATAEGRRRLNEPNDFVRLEIEAALARGIRVIPLLVDGADPPRAEDLPDSLAPLANRQFTRLTHETFTADAARLTHALSKIVENAAPEPGPPEPARTEDASVRFDPAGSTTGAARDGKSGIQYSAHFARSAPRNAGSTPTASLADDAPSAGRAPQQDADPGEKASWRPLLRRLAAAFAALCACMFVLVFIVGARLGMTALALVLLVFFTVWIIPIPGYRHKRKAEIAFLVALSVLLVMAFLF